MIADISGLRSILPVGEQMNIPNHQFPLPLIRLAAVTMLQYHLQINLQITIHAQKEHGEQKVTVL